MKFKNKGGEHALADGTKIKRGETFESDVDVRKVFINKFELVGEGDDTPVGVPPAPEAVSTPEHTPDAPAGATGGEDDLDDVTAEFRVDPDSGITVRKEGSKCNVYEEGDPEPLNEKPLAKGKVQAFIDDYLAEGEGE